jgi:hypothetical protein
VRLVRQWHELAEGLPAGWGDAQLRLHLRDAAQLDRATALLGPLQPTRSAADTLSFRVTVDGSGPTQALADRALELVDREGIAGTLELESTAVAAVAPAVDGREPQQTLPQSWDAALATLPADWSDLLGEVELDSSDYLERAALQLSPLNPRRDGDRFALRFRCARKAGYGASPQMVARCLERCAAEGIAGRVHVLRALSDTHPAQTQGPVWLLSGYTV